MIKVEPHNWWFLLGGKLFFGEEWTDEHIFLAKAKGDVMKYWANAFSRVDFPGEYDIDSVWIKCIDAWSALHYIISFEWETIALLQAVSALEKANIDWIDTWLVMNDEVKTEIENLELEGDVVVLWAEIEATWE